MSAQPHADNLRSGNIGSAVAAALDWASLGWLVFLMVVNVLDVLGVLRDPSSYPLGSEAAGMRYKTRSHLIAWSSVTAFVCLAGIVAPILVRRRGNVVAATVLRVLVALLGAGQVALLASQYD